MACAARRCLLALLALFALTGARDPILVADVSQPKVEVRQGFTGTELLLFGAILTPEGARAGGDYDIVVVLEGPARPVVLREKRKIAGVWVNADSTTLRSMPSYYAVASSRPIRQIVDERTAAIYEMGLTSLQLSPSDMLDQARQDHFAAGLVDLMVRKGLYRQEENAVTMTGQVLYSARIALPSSVQTGTYTAETFAIRKGRVVASALTHVVVSKQGFERAVADYSRHRAFAYGLVAVLVSVLMGWVAGRLFALV
ncbi:MAG TPA: TIGR02186 family protein [Novosphingobium sp.]|nr:TIGR02186 family protein [Novosphingobium sp.]